MKSVLLNVIFSQQFGMGFYGAGSRLAPFAYLHCYLNIPDTSGRDSLFQAEARRCKEILDVVRRETTVEHFIIFDELFSGTNPEEAVKSSAAFIKYLGGLSNVAFMLTTHYRKVCKHFAKSDKIRNYQMAVIQGENTIQYTYKVERGISKVRGGLQVLREMDYPKEIFGGGA